MKLLTSFAIIFLFVACHSRQATPDAVKTSATPTADPDLVPREAMTGREKADFNYFAVEKDKDGRFWFSLGAQNDGYVAFSYGSIKNAIIVTDKGVYHQKLKEEDIKKECNSSDPKDENVICMKKAFFTFNKKDEHPMIVLTMLKAHEVTFAPIQAQKIAPKDTLELVRKNLNQDIACKNIGEHFDGHKRYWEVECSRIIEKKKNKYGLIYAFGKGDMNLFLQGIEGNKTFKGDKNPPSIIEPCNSGVEYKKIKILNCWEGSYVLLDDRFVEITFNEYYSVATFFYGELTIDTKKYLVLWIGTDYLPFGESKHLNLISVRNSKLYYINSMIEGYSTFSIE